MSLTAGKQLLLSSPAGGYQVSRSLRFNAGDTPTLTRVFGTPSSTTKWTYSAWIKRVKTSTNGYGDILLATLNPSTGTDARLAFLDNDTFYYLDWNGGQLATTSVYRDFSAWLHLVFVYDSANATSTDRLRLYINGTRITSSNGLSSASYPSLNATSVINGARSHTMGAFDTPNPYYMNAYLADVWFLDGVATDASSFGETDATTGQWIPKAYTGSKGTNGFHLEFADNSAATAAALGKDTSGNGNNWTPNNLSVTAGAGNDSLVDTPTSYGTNTGAGGEVRGNYATWNPLDKGSSMTLTNGNLDVSTASTWNTVRATFGLTSGKWYWEYTMTAAGLTMVGIVSTVIGGYTGDSSSGYAFYSLNGNKYNAGATAYGSSFTTNDVIGVAFDADAGKIWYAKNGTWQASGNPAAGTNAAFSSIASLTYFPAISQDNTDGVTGGVLNAGARAFAYTAPSGFKALCDTNLTAPVIAKPNTLMDAKLYTGNGSTNNITGLNFSPDFVWIKRRDSAGNHALFDAVRGTGKFLESSTTGSETTSANSLTAFNSDGFSLGTETQTNTNSATYVAWTWDANSSNTTNTAGSITSTVRANATAGFSIVSWTSTSSSATIGHGLNAEPYLIITKGRSGVDQWVTYHKSIGATQYLYLNSTDAAATYSGFWNNTAPTSTVFTTGTDAIFTTNGRTKIAYCFAPVAGYSSMGSYVGNGSTDGPFVFTGHRSRWILIKRTDAADDWNIFDTARSTYNVMGHDLLANRSDAEYTGTYIDCLSNGFKIRETNSSRNASGGTYIYFAVAENPFQYARAR